MRRLLAVLALCLVATGAWGLSSAERIILFSGGSNFTYYVDSVHGSDANSGTSRAPKQNITALPSITAGQSVGLARGSYWRQQLTVSANNVTVGSYGAGALPILDASDQILNASLTADGSGCYFTGTITPTQAGVSAAWINVWETGGPGDSATGTFLQNVASQALCDSTAGSYFISGLSTGSGVPATIVIYIHPTDSSNAISNGYKYEYSNRRAGLLMTSLHGVVSNIEGRKSSYNDGAIELEGDGNAYTASGVIARDGGKHNMFAAGGSTVNSSTLINSYYPSGGNLLVYFDGTGSGLPISANGNIFQQDQAPSGQTGSSIIAHTSSGSIGTASFTNNWFIAKNSVTLSGLSLANTGSMTTNNNLGSGLQSYIFVQANTTMTGDQMVSNFTNNNPVQFGASGITVTANGIKFCSGSSQNGLFYVNNTAGTLNISNSLLYLNTPNAGFEIGVNAPNATTLSVTGTDIGTAHTVVYYYNLFAASGDVFTGNNNIYEPTTTMNWTLNNSTTHTLANWQAAVSPQDAASVTTGGNAVAACTLPTMPTVN